MISNAIFLNASINKDRDFNQFKSNRFGKEKSRDSENNFENFGLFHKIRNCLGGNESKYKRLKLQKTPKRGSFRFKNEVAEILICIGCPGYELSFGRSISNHKTIIENHRSAYDINYENSFWT